MLMDDADREMLTLLRDSDGQAPPLEAFDLFRSAIGSETPDAIYSEGTVSDSGAEWTIWAILGQAVVRVTAPLEFKAYRYELAAYPSALIFPLRVAHLTPTTSGGPTVWQAGIRGPAGELLTIDLPSKERYRNPTQREKAETFASALRKAMIGNHSATSEEESSQSG